jgi:hypothetical protein
MSDCPQAASFIFCFPIVIEDMKILAFLVTWDDAQRAFLAGGSRALTLHRLTRHNRLSLRWNPPILSRRDRSITKKYAHKSTHESLWNACIHPISLSPVHAPVVRVAAGRGGGRPLSPTNQGPKLSLEIFSLPAGSIGRLSNGRPAHAPASSRPRGARARFL